MAYDRNTNLKQLGEQFLKSGGANAEAGEIREVFGLYGVSEDD